MSKIFRPRRGNQKLMSTLKASSLILEEGEIFIEYPETGVGTSTEETGVGIKIGNGKSMYRDLPYYLQDRTKDINTLLNEVFNEESGINKRIDELFDKFPVKTSEGGTGNTEGYIHTGAATLNSSVQNSTVEGLGNIVTGGSVSHTEGYMNTNTGTYSHAEGNQNTVSGNSAHAEGINTQASGEGSHSEGHTTIASGQYSHAEGFNCYATGNYAHTEGGQLAIANGEGSHAEGSFTNAININAHAEGRGTTASGIGSHAEGYYSTASGNYSHAEGYNASASGYEAHAEGYNTKATKDYSHAEGAYTTAIGNEAHAEGYETTASGNGSHAEGDRTIADGDYSHAEGNRSNARGYVSHAEGYGTTASGTYSHAEGYETTVSGRASHAEGYNTTVSGAYSHAEGYSTTASGSEAHAEGSESIASGDISHAEGETTKAIGKNSHAGGYRSEARALGSFVHGEGLIADTDSSRYQTIVGRYNNNNMYIAARYPSSEGMGTVIPVRATGASFVVGGGGSDSDRSNAMMCVNGVGIIVNGGYWTGGADYAEYFEWIDANKDNQDRRGLFVTLDGDKIKLASSEDDYILGVISATPTVIGDSYLDEWCKRYETDIFGSKIYEEYETEELDKDGNKIKSYRPKVNPEYDLERVYESRLSRVEWDAVGLMGKVVVVDDGTGEVNGYVYPGNNGIATKSNEKTRFRVMKRLDDTHIRIMIL